MNLCRHCLRGGAVYFSAWCSDCFHNVMNRYVHTPCDSRPNCTHRITANHAEGHRVLVAQGIQTRAYIPIASYGMN